MHSAKKTIPDEKKYTYSDYLMWEGDSRRWEIINGEIYDMSPAPSNKHQFVIWEISGQIRDYLKAENRSCHGRNAPFDVRFPEGVWEKDKITDVVQPDILVVCDQSKFDDKGCQGAPDFIIEILSPNTASKDFTVKHSLYEKNRVMEYWIIDPVNKSVIIYLLGEDGRYSRPAIHPGKGRLEATALNGLEIDLDAVFDTPVFGS
ncbi:MAG: Uma2 family endonuclease [Desulfamplus sp.]|nr:Uma2 family endonuclease [Desulfamplus sp.]